LPVVTSKTLIQRLSIALSFVLTGLKTLFNVDKTIQLVRFMNVSQNLVSQAQLKNPLTFASFLFVTILVIVLVVLTDAR
jgi:uncharacterized membrane protein YphA (DoxX/SURF4 family)